MICPPYRLSRPDRYCRLLPPFQHPGARKDVEYRLTELAKSMFRARQKRSLEEPVAEETEREHFRAAYTYFGQFIMHDLTFDDTPFRSAGVQEPEETINYRSPRLDLDSVYGDGPFSATHCHLYDGPRFRLGKAYNHSDAFFDVPLIDCLPAVVDERNCENAILRQIHAMFLILHNHAVDILETGDERDEWTLFQMARARVRWQFQWLVRQDFLPRICNRDVYKAITVEGQRLIHWPAGRFSIPVEFSHAAARFGHSLVRELYELRETHGQETVSLPELFGSTRLPGPLEKRMAVNWQHFAKVPVKDFDTRLVDPFSKLPDAVIHSYVTSPMPHEPHMLAERTLRRGAATWLPTGQQLRVALDPSATIKVSKFSDEALENLREQGFEHETPLWYYVLFEAETNGGRRRLGRIGTRIVVEVIEAALLHDQDSFFFQENDEWRRDLLKDCGEGAAPIETLADLATVLGLEPKL